jgi:hypothetical protein
LADSSALTAKADQLPTVVHTRMRVPSAVVVLSMGVVPSEQVAGGGGGVVVVVVAGAAVVDVVVGAAVVDVVVVGATVVDVVVGAAVLDVVVDDTHGLRQRAVAAPAGETPVIVTRPPSTSAPAIRPRCTRRRFTDGFLPEFGLSRPGTRSAHVGRRLSARWGNTPIGAGDRGKGGLCLPRSHSGDSCGMHRLGYLLIVALLAVLTVVGVRFTVSHWLTAAGLYGLFLTLVAFALLLSFSLSMRDRDRHSRPIPR